MSYGSVDVQRLFRNLLLALRREVLKRSHIVQPVGELDEHYADVIHHGKHHLAQVLGLLLFARGKVNLPDLGDAFDNMRDLFAKLLANVHNRDRGVLDRIVQQPGDNGDRIHLYLRQNAGYFQRMDQVRLTRRPTLPGMNFQRIFVGFLDDLQIVVGPVGPQHLHQVTKASDGEDIGRDLLA